MVIFGVVNFNRVFQRKNPIIEMLKMAGRQIGGLADGGLIFISDNLWKRTTCWIFLGTILHKGYSYCTDKSSTFIKIGSCSLANRLYIGVHTDVSILLVFWCVTIYNIIPAVELRVFFFGGGGQYSACRKPHFSE